MAKQLHRMMINRMYKTSGIITEEEDHEEIEVGIIPEGVPLIQIGYNGRATVNMGDYNSTQIGVSIVLPTTLEELDHAYSAAKNFVDSRLSKEVNEARKARK